MVVFEVPWLLNMTHKEKTSKKVENQSENKRKKDNSLFCFVTFMIPRQH
jgi:hypothetical protein